MTQLECLSIIDSSLKPLLVERISGNSILDMNNFINIACDSLEQTLSNPPSSQYYGGILRMESYYVYAQRSPSSLFVLALIKSENNIPPSDSIVKDFLNSFYHHYVMMVVSNPFRNGTLLPYFHFNDDKGKEDKG